MAEKFEKIIEHGKTGIVVSSNVSFTAEQDVRIYGEKLIEKHVSHYRIQLQASSTLSLKTLYPLKKSHLETNYLLDIK